MNKKQESPPAKAAGEIGGAPSRAPAEAPGDAGEGRISRTLLFYERPVPLNRETHRDLRLRDHPGDFSFARCTNSIPVAGIEFPEACRDYPIVFAGTSPAASIPTVLVGLRADENLFVGSDGRWEPVYVPAFVRRYPFVLAEKPEPGDFTVCVDEGYPGLGTGEGEPLFDEQGKETPPLQRALQFLGEFQGQMQRTREFVERLASMDLLQPKVIQVAPKDAAAFVLQGVFVVDEARLREVDDAALRTLFDAGELGWIYAHLISLANINSLTLRLDRRH
ncbi:MAG TPA: SapC family protein [Gammaproteobacteria bacterium]|nr:SapC family protein [Gammaproteobacteria bacterium]